MAALLQTQKNALRKSMRTILANCPAEDVQAQSRQITNTLLALPEFRQGANVSCFLSMPAGEVDTSAVVAAIIHAGKNLYVPRTTDKDRGLMDMFQVFSDDDLRALPRGSWGIREPDVEYKGIARPTALGGGADAEPLDLIVIPGLAFDRSLSRLGYGKGYYDRFLASYAALLREDSSSSSRQQSRRPKLGEFPECLSFVSTYMLAKAELRLRLDLLLLLVSLSLLFVALAVALALREQILEAGQVPVGECDWKVDVIVGPDGIVSRGRASDE